MLAAISAEIRGAAKNFGGAEDGRDASKYGRPLSEDEADFSLRELGADGCPKLNVRVMAAVDREDFTGNSFVAFVLRCRFGEQEWRLEKRFRKFHALHEQLVALLGRDLAARLPALRPRLANILGPGAREVQERRHRLDAYMQELCRMAASGPLQGTDACAGDDAAYKSALHVLHELYRFVEFVGHVVPGKGDRALNEDEDNSDNEGENQSTFQSPALVLALKQMKRVNEQLADKQLACESARGLKLHLGQQLVQTLEQVSKLRASLTSASEQIEAVLSTPQHPQLRLLPHSPGTGPTNSSAAQLAVGSPLAAAAAAVWGRARERRAAAGAQPRASPCSTPTPTSALAVASLAASTAGAATAAPASRHDAAVGGVVGGVERRGGLGVDAFAVMLYNVRGKVSALKREHLTAEHSRSWLSLWRGKVQTRPPSNLACLPRACVCRECVYALESLRGIATHALGLWVPPGNRCLRRRATRVFGRRLRRRRLGWQQTCSRKT